MRGVRKKIEPSTTQLQSIPMESTKQLLFLKKQQPGSEREPAQPAASLNLPSAAP
jgi:hypothetical protein